MEKIFNERLQSLNPLVLEYEDDSFRHAGHAGNSGGGHYKLLIVSDVFIDKSRITRQRLIQDLLKDLYDSKIHALNIRALTATEYQQVAK